jgi:hypothetical protein
MAEVPRTSATAPDGPLVRAPLAPSRRRAARYLALGADALQIVLLPLFGEGFASPANDALDVAVAIVLVKLVGFHWAFLPAAAAELVPVLDLAPTWTAAVLLATGTDAGKRRFLWPAVVVAVLIAAAIAYGLRGRL